jgi:hypothetical protein
MGKLLPGTGVSRPVGTADPLGDSIGPAGVEVIDGPFTGVVVIAGDRSSYEIGLAAGWGLVIVQPRLAGGFAAEGVAPLSGGPSGYGVAPVNAGAGGLLRGIAIRAIGSE